MLLVLWIGKLNIHPIVKKQIGKVQDSEILIIFFYFIYLLWKVKWGIAMHNPTQNIA